MDYDVSLAGKPNEHLVAQFGFQIKAHPELASVHTQESPAFSRQRGWIFAQIIPLGRLNLDDLGPHVRQEIASVWPGDIGAQVQYFDTG